MSGGGAALWRRKKNYSIAGKSRMDFFIPKGSDLKNNHIIFFNAKVRHL
jgi:hypothetical protein